MRLLDKELSRIIAIELVERPLEVDFHPNGKFINFTGGFKGSSIEEVSSETLLPTRCLNTKNE